MKVIGLTGGIATGKSTVKRILEEYSLLVVDTDEIAHQELMFGAQSYLEVVDEFGTNILKEDKSIDRRKLAEIVFTDDKKRRVLENILHPRIKDIVVKIIARERKNNREVMFLDVPLLFEVGWQKQVDEVWLVYTNEAVQLKRLMERDCVAEEYAVLRISKQMPIQEKLVRADKVIDNSGSIETLRKQISLIL